MYIYLFIKNVESSAFPRPTLMCTTLHLMILV